MAELTKAKCAIYEEQRIMDNVNHPSHYAGEASSLVTEVRGIFVTDCDAVNMECIQAMVNEMDSVDEIRGYLRGNAFKYQWRYRNKNGLEDLKKAKVYLNWLIDLEKVVDTFWGPSPFS